MYMWNFLDQLLRQVLGFFFPGFVFFFFSGERGRMLGRRHKIFSRVENPIRRLTQKVRKTTRG